MPLFKKHKIKFRGTTGSIHRGRQHFKLVLEAFDNDQPPPGTLKEWARATGIKLGLDYAKVVAALTTMRGLDRDAFNKDVSIRLHKHAEVAAEALGLSISMAMRVFQEAMSADRLVLVGEEFIRVPDHKVRLEAAKSFLTKLGADAPTRVENEVDIGQNLVDLNVASLKARMLELMSKAATIEGVEKARQLAAPVIDVGLEDDGN